MTIMVGKYIFFSLASAVSIDGRRNLVFFSSLYISLYSRTISIRCLSCDRIGSVNNSTQNRTTIQLYRRCWLQQQIVVIVVINCSYRNFGNVEQQKKNNIIYESCAHCYCIPYILSSDAPDQQRYKSWTSHKKRWN